MPIHCWEIKEGWACRWGKEGKVYKAATIEEARRKAKEQMKAAYASGYKK